VPVPIWLVLLCDHGFHGPHTHTQTCHYTTYGPEPVGARTRQNKNKKADTPVVGQLAVPPGTRWVRGSGWVGGGARLVAHVPLSEGFSERPSKSV
jgi:hypothetical protein